MSRVRRPPLLPLSLSLRAFCYRFALKIIRVGKAQVVCPQRAIFAMPCGPPMPCGAREGRACARCHLAHGQLDPLAHHAVKAVRAATCRLRLRPRCRRGMPGVVVALRLEARHGRAVVRARCRLLAAQAHLGGQGKPSTSKRPWAYELSCPWAQTSFGPASVRTRTRTRHAKHLSLSNMCTRVLVSRALSFFVARLLPFFQTRAACVGRLQKRAACVGRPFFQKRAACVGRGRPVPRAYSRSSGSIFTLSAVCRW